MRWSLIQAVVRVGAGALLFTAAIKLGGETGTSVPFPAAYRAWAVARSLVIGPENESFATNGGFHHYYVNEKALEGIRSGHFPDGAVVVDERLEVLKEAGISLEGPRKSVAVMFKDAKRYPNTGGWGFDVFAGEDQTAGASESVRAACYSCHVRRSEHDFVFSEFRK